MPMMNSRTPPRSTPPVFNGTCPVCRSSATRPFQIVGDLRYGTCRKCRAVFLDPAQRLDPARELERYRLHRNDVNDPAYRAFLRRLSDPLLARLPPGREGLDYGCGPGPALAAMLREAGHRVEIYDPFFAPDAGALERDYDFITCTEVVEHFRQPAEEFDRLDRLLRPGGWLGILTSFLTRDDRFATWHYRRDPTHVVFYRESTFRFLAARRSWRCEFPAPNVALLQKASAAGQPHNQTSESYFVLDTSAAFR